MVTSTFQDSFPGWMVSQELCSGQKLEAYGILMLLLLCVPKVVGCLLQKCQYVLFSRQQHRFGACRGQERYTMELWRAIGSLGR